MIGVIVKLIVLTLTVGIGINIVLFLWICFRGIKSNFVYINIDETQRGPAMAVEIVKELRLGEDCLEDVKLLKNHNVKTSYVD